MQPGMQPGAQAGRQATKFTGAPTAASVRLRGNSHGSQEKSLAPAATLVGASWMAADHAPDAITISLPLPAVRLLSSDNLASLDFN